MHLKTFAGIIIFGLFSCIGEMSHKTGNTLLAPTEAAWVEADKISAIPLPEGFTRIAAGAGSFAEWLRTIKIKKDKTVYLYDGSVKANQTAQFAVLDISVGNKNLQQCADAIMRLRAEYLFSIERYGDISFTDNDGGIYKFEPPYSSERFNKYLERVFGMCGSASLSKQLKRVAMQNMKLGDVLIKGGFPGHAVIVMDMAENDMGEKIYLLAQSYMPAQDIHILKNYNNPTLSPWYLLSDNDISTPEYFFTSNQLKTW